MMLITIVINVTHMHTCQWHGVGKSTANIMILPTLSIVNILD